MFSLRNVEGVGRVPRQRQKRLPKMHKGQGFAVGKTSSRKDVSHQKEVQEKRTRKGCKVGLAKEMAKEKLRKGIGTAAGQIPKEHRASARMPSQIFPYRARAVDKHLCEAINKEAQL
jgi:hypothetical protein